MLHNWWDFSLLKLVNFGVSKLWNSFEKSWCFRLEFFLLEVLPEKSPLIGGIYFTVQKVVNTTASKNNTFHQDFHFTTIGVAFYNPSGLTVYILLNTNKVLIMWLVIGNCPKLISEQIWVVLIGKMGLSFRVHQSVLIRKVSSDQNRVGNFWALYQGLAGKYKKNISARNHSELLGKWKFRSVPVSTCGSV